MENAAAPTPPSNGKIDGTNETRIRVLCVDDETSFLNSTKQILQIKGLFFVDTASSVDEALKKMKSTEFDVVVSDYMMPEKNGLDFLKELRENNNDIPFILFTGQGREEVAIKALNLGADRYFNKFGHPETVYGELAHSIRQSTAQRVAEKQIWDREERLRAILASSPDALIVIDLKGTIIDCNLETLKLLEVASKKDVIGINCSSLAAPADKETTKQASIKLLKEGAVHNIECNFLTKNGEVPVEYSANILRDAYSRPIGAVVLARNISERKKTEEELLQSESRFRDFFDHSPVYCYILSLDGKIMETNKSALTALGYTKEELLGKPVISTIYAPSSRRKAKRLFEKNKSGEDFEDEEMDILTKKGKKRTVVLRGQCAVDVDGKILYFVSVQRDITEEKKADETRKKSEEKYRNIVELSPDGIATMNMKGTITSVNRSFLELTGFSEQEIVGKHFSKLGTLKAKDVPRYAKIVTSILSGKKVGNVEFDYYCKDGTHRFGEARIGLLKEKGKTVGLQAILSDITERKYIERELKESEEKFRSAFEQSPEGIFTFDMNGVITSCNPAGLDATGFSKEEIVGKHFTELVPLRGLDNKKFLAIFSTIVEGKIPKPFEISYLVKGKPYFGEVQVSLIKKGKKVTGFQSIIRNTTEKRKAEEAIKSSEEKYRSIVELSPDGIISLDTNGVITQVNRAILDQTGFSEKDFLGKHFTQLAAIQVENLSEFTKTIEHFLRGKIPTSVFEFAYCCKDGTQRVAEASIGLLNQNDQNAGIQLLLRDITERKITENTLKESEEKFRMLAEQSPNMIFINQNGKVVYVNPKCEEIMGYTKEEFYSPNFNFFDVIAQESVELISSSFSRHTKGEEVPPFEYSIVTKEGKRIEAILTTKLIRYNGQNAILGTITDITKRKHMENAIRTGEEKYRSMLDTVNVLVQSVDKNGKFVYVNKEWMKVLGYSGKEFKKLHLMDIIRTDYHKHCMKLFKQVVNGKEVRDIETVFVSKDGNEIMVSGNIKPIFSDGKFISTVGFFLDITERKKAENALEETLNEMAVLNEKLGVVGKLTRHDARNKLSTIVNNAYLIKKQLENNPSALEQLADIELSIDQIEKIFEFTRIYEMLGTQQLGPIEVKNCLEEAFMLASRSDGIQFVNECNGLTVVADSLLRQIFYNLVDNSLKHGENVTQIRAYYKEEPDKLKIVYEDNGVGVSEDQKELIFKEGYGKGSGYGLYLINKICEEYGWTISETSKPEEGAKFVITIPKLDQNGKNSYTIKKP